MLSSSGRAEHIGARDHGRRTSFSVSLCGWRLGGGPLEHSYEPLLGSLSEGSKSKRTLAGFQNFKAVRECTPLMEENIADIHLQHIKKEAGRSYDGRVRRNASACRDRCPGFRFRHRRICNRSFFKPDFIAELKPNVFVLPCS